MTSHPDHIRILHTADWHLGREFHGADLTAAHRHFFDWLADQIQEREVDVVLMAGDIFDRALPPLNAIETFNEEVNRLADLVPIVLITGNHDSTVRLSHGPLLRDGIHLLSGTAAIGRPVMLDGGSFPLAIYPIPYLDPVASAPELDAEAANHEAVLARSVELCLENLSGLKTGTRSVGIAHAFVTGAETSSSERGIFVGGSEDLPAGVFEGFDYVALGHLHRPQRISDRVWYSGSPLFLSYSELSGDAGKSIMVVDLAADGSIEADAVPIPPFAQLSRISGTLSELLDSDEFTGFEDHWLEVTLTDTSRPENPMERLKARFPQIMSLQFSKLTLGESAEEVERLSELSRTSPMELITEFLQSVRGKEPDEHERKILQEALEHSTSREVRG